MSEISKSPKRATFQRERYIERCEKDGKLPSQAYLDMYENDMKRHDSRFNNEEHKKDNLEYDLLTTEWILNKVRASDVYAQNLYAAICNNDFQKLEVMPILRDQTWSCSWRYAGGIIADMRQEGDYIDWYCSGIGGLASEYPKNGRKENYVSESVVTDEIREDLLKLGWIVRQIKDE